MGYVRPIECERTQRNLSVALDTELSQLERAHVDAHLERCEQCRSFDVRIGELTRAIRVAPLERLDIRVRLPLTRRSGWRTAGRFASAGTAAAAVVAAFVGFAAAPDRSTWKGDGALIASALDRPAGTNDLLIDVIRPSLVSRQHQAIAFGEGGIGAYKRPLAPDA
jgi:predicted anti-sigma-YlaC factor YlaD